VTMAFRIIEAFEESARTNSVNVSMVGITSDAVPWLAERESDWNRCCVLVVDCSRVPWPCIVTAERSAGRNDRYGIVQ
jgi:hypothetical protein